MRRIALLLIPGFFLFSGCKTKKPVADISAVSGEYSSYDQQGAVDFSEQITWLLGYFTEAQMRREPHSSWYIKGYDEYKPDSAAIVRLNNLGHDDITIRIVMGTWCPDSRREVPRFMRILDLWQFPAGNLTFIGVDNAKQSPIGGYEELDIQRVPTFIVYKNNLEAGRIIENPVTSLEQDMVKILEGMNNNK